MFVIWNASQIVLITVHLHPKISPLAMIEHKTPISFPKRHIPNLNPDNLPKPHIPTKHSRLNWLRTRMTVTHFITATNCPLRSRVVEISCSTTSEWSEYFQNHHLQRQYCDCPHHHHNYHHHQNLHHHHSQTCDWPRSVMQIRPECRDPESFRFRLGPRSWDSRRSGMMRATLMMTMMMAMAL